jgi:HEPN domain-containing protein
MLFFFIFVVKFMKKQDYINYWKTAAEKDWVVVDNLFKKRNYPQCLFFAHLVLEKLLKAHWVKDNKSDNPPRIHNLVKLAVQTKLKLTSDNLIHLDIMNDYQMEGRYPDYQFLIYKIATRKNTKNLLEQSNILKQWLLNQLP